MADHYHESSPSPWRGACRHCGGLLMRVHRRPIAGGMPVWATASIMLMVFGLTVISVMEAGAWPFGLVAFLFGLWLGIHRFERWQCRRCRVMYREIVGENRKLDTDKVLRAPS